MAMLLCAAAGMADEGKAWFQNVIQEAGFPKGSSIQFAHVSKDAIFVSNTKMTNSVVLAKDGVVLFVDEKPSLDWAHPFQLLFVPKATLKPEVLFRGSAIPSFELRNPDGTKIKNWEKY
jgi:hypothetical protein